MHVARPIPLPPFVVRELKAHRKRQLEQKLAFGAAWQDTGLVCTMPDGSPINPDTLNGRFSRRVKQVGFPRLIFHGLRHSRYRMLANC